MACGAPTSWSSGGRLAVHTSSGTPARSASTTAGWSSTAAVPLVVSTITASPDAAASPSARKPPLRSSWWTWTVMRSSAASASASGVDREPGQTTACSTPSRAHSSTRVAQNVAWRSSGRGAMAPTSDHTLSARIHAMFLHAERRGAGPTLVLVHGFTQTGRCWGPEVDALAADHEVVLVDAPGHGRSAEVMAGLRTGGRLIADQGGEATYLGYSMGARFCLHVALANPELVRGLVLLGATAGIEDPDGARAAAPAGPGHRRAHRARRPGGVPRRLARPAALRRPPAGAIVPTRSAWRTPSRACSRASSRPAPASQDPSWHELHRLDMPVLVLAGARRRQVRRARRAPGRRRSATTPPLALIEGAGHAAHLEQPDRFLPIVQTLARPPRPLTATVRTRVQTVRSGAAVATGQPLSQRPPARRVPLTELDPAGGAEDGDEGGAGGALEDLEHRLAGQDDADEGGRRGRAAEAAGHDRDARRTRRRACRRRASGCGRRRCGRRACACPTRCRRGCRGGC